LKPKVLSFADAASLPLAGVTALQVLGQYRGSLEGKTVLIPGGRKSHITSIIDRNTDACL
jgi:NADPH:quinone reductase-like Zn-dependent oxidoreductase